MMCTLSFLPAKEGYTAAMNRDELLSRPPALPPAIRPTKGLELLYPREAGGGTWIGANSRGNLLALLNWYSKENGRLGQKNRSRGELIPTLLLEPDLNRVSQSISVMDLAGVFPFRLFGFFPDIRQIFEWRWNLKELTAQSHVWKRQHWFSSSRSDEQAAKVRGISCAEAWPGEAADPSSWLRDLHASHGPKRGAFSICVHREDAASVSYAEVEWKCRELQMRYLRGNPCQGMQSLEVWSLPARVDAAARG